MSNKKLKKITPESRNKLIGLVNKTAEFVVDGNTPTDALAKAASGQEYSPEFILRAAEAYNGAAHLQHFKSAALDTRGDSFDIVDGNQVLCDLIGNRQVEKVANVAPADFFSEDRYYFESALPTCPMQKAASSVPAAPLDLKDLIVGARKLEEQEKVAEEEARQDLLQSLKSLEIKLAEVRKEFKTLSTPELTKAGTEAVYSYGISAFPAAIELCGLDAKTCVGIATQKEATFRGVPTHITELTGSLVEACEACHTCSRVLGDKQAEMYVNSTQRRAAIEDVLGISPAQNINTYKIAEAAANVEVDDLNNILKQSFALAVPSAIGGGLLTRGLDTAQNAAQEATNRNFSPAGQAESQLRGIQGLLDPSFLREVKEIELATMLKKVLQDPIISAHSPRAIEEALYEVQSLAPQATTYEPLLRAMLRTRLESEGRLDDLEVNQLLDVDSKLVKKDTPEGLFFQRFPAQAENSFQGREGQ